MPNVKLRGFIQSWIFNMRVSERLGSLVFIQKHFFQRTQQLSRGNFSSQVLQCAERTQGVWCRHNWDTVHQCDRCLGNHPTARCPHAELQTPTFVKNAKGGKGRGRSGRGGGKGKRPAYILTTGGYMHACGCDLSGREFSGGSPDYRIWKHPRLVSLQRSAQTY